MRWHPIHGLYAPRHPVFPECLLRVRHRSEGVGSGGEQRAEVGRTQQAVTRGATAMGRRGIRAAVGMGARLRLWTKVALQQGLEGHRQLVMGTWGGDAKQRAAVAVAPHGHRREGLEGGLSEGGGLCGAGAQGGSAGLAPGELG